MSAELLARLRRKEERCLARPAKDDLRDLIAESADRIEALLAEVERVSADNETLRGLIGELIDWFGAADWNGPQIDVDLGRRISHALVRARPSLVERVAVMIQSTVEHRALRLHDESVADR